MTTRAQTGIATATTVVATLAAFGLASSDVAAQDLAFRQVASGVPGGLYLESPRDDDRLFVLEQNGRIRIVHPDTSLTTFLDVSGISQSGGEQGLLGLAFHPDYSNNGYFFINYTDNSGDTVVARYSVSGDPDVADPGSALEILSINQPFSNHNGGMLAFGQDGYLYIGTGDGGSGGDPFDNAQDPTTLLGKMLRIDIDNPDGGNNYGIPADNPFVDDASTLDEIWALGLRNPWRYSFDRETGDLWIGDVGQNEWEEIDFQPASSAGGENYGWRLKEGTNCYNPPTNCDPGGLTDPIYEYIHPGNPNRCSVTGGYVYRGKSMPLLNGRYFFGDFCTAEMWSFRYEDNAVVDFMDHPELDIGSGLRTYGEDADGELYFIADAVYQITTAMQLQTSLLIGGQNATFIISDATPDEPVYIVYSLSGTGRTNVPQLGVDLALSNPVLGVRANADSFGGAFVSRSVPGIASGREIWIQAAVNGNTSNVVNQVIQ